MKKHKLIYHYEQLIVRKCRLIHQRNEIIDGNWSYWCATTLFWSKYRKTLDYIDSNLTLIEADLEQTEKYITKALNKGCKK